MLNTIKTFGIVGSRLATSYGRKVTRMFSHQLALYGFTIVSGFIYGVDSIAHIASLNSNLLTIGVLWYGFDFLLKQQVGDLQKYISSDNKNLLLLSAYAPQQPAARWSFAKRNTLITAFSGYLLVTEASKKSGSIITATQALKMNKSIFVVSSNIGSIDSEGIAHLNTLGAVVLMSMDSLSTNTGVKLSGISSKPLSLGTDATLTYDKVSQVLTSMTNLLKELNWSSSRLYSSVFELEIRGLVEKDEVVLCAK